MKLATVRQSDGSTTAARLDGDRLVAVPGEDVGALLRRSSWEDAARGADGADLGEASAAELAPVVPRPGKIVCVGLNYATHILEMGRELPEHPALFAKYAEALTGSRDSIVLPDESTEVDWEAELAVVVGRAVRRASEDEAASAIAGFAVLNDVTMRDWQYRTIQWLQGKTFESSSPFGPFLVTPDEVGGARPDLAIRTVVDGEVMQESRTGDLVFDPVDLVQYISRIVTLHPGDVISTGTPGGVGHARTPARYLGDGNVLVTEIEGLGACRNPVAAPVGVA